MSNEERQKTQDIDVLFSDVKFLKKVTLVLILWNIILVSVATYKVTGGGG